MSEDKKIEELIKKYKEYFDNSNADVCKTIKGVWFFYRYDTKTDYFECFYRFNTADELKRIIESEIFYDMSYAIESTADNIVSNMKSYDINNCGSDWNYREHMDILISNLEDINRLSHVFEGLSKALSDVLSDKESNK